MILKSDYDYRVLDVAQMREADRRCIKELGIPGVALMNQAGRAIFEVLEEMNPSGGAVGIVCGKGNNGGDGFVVARLSLLAGWDTLVLLLATPEEVQGDAETFMRVYQRLGGEQRNVTDFTQAIEAIQSMAYCTVLVDAILGTGVVGAPRGVFHDVISAWPEIPTLAVDIPSGLNADTGEATGPCIRAVKTVTLQHMKKGFLNKAALHFLGEVVVADIGIPSVCADDTAWEKLNCT